jgi:hypothetical protein
MQLHGLCLLVVSSPGSASPMPEVGLELLAALLGINLEISPASQELK